jgi:hypothetical protein
MFNYFYNQNLRKLVVGFGSLFSNINVQHDNPEDTVSPLIIRVPITYAPQEKFIRRLLETSSISDGTRIENQLPRLSYMMSSVTPDPSRRRNKSTTSKTMVGSPGNCNGSSANFITEEVPVNVSFSLFVYTRHLDDTLQIVEQIIPYFNPDHIITIDMNSAQSDVRIPITMLSNNISERYDGDFGNRRVNISSFNFVAKSYIFGKIETQNVISSVGPPGISFDLNWNY